ncbi:carboxypeptidase-like regulatory domain-containing protein [Mucilaginibacter pedocola]|nr:carboxypeptidase-like regulatory domain-containing protein [Mucilaginibacter pedocola]
MRKLLTFILLFVCGRAFCQHRLHGRVTDLNGMALPGTSVFISESKHGTATDSLGNFVLTSPGGGNLKLVVSHVGYEAQVKAISADAADSTLLFMLKPVSKQLKDVIVSSRANDDWKHWGAAFLAAFIGNSAFAKNCTIENYREIGFKYDNDEQVLNAYTSVPLKIKNESLGYLITINLVDFVLYTPDNDVDYQAYYLFEEMKGDAAQQKLWEQNRRKAYALSMMHFSRALYANKLKEEGYEVRRFSMKDIREKERVTKIFADERIKNADYLKDKENTEEQVTMLVEKHYGADSLAYYRKMLAKQVEDIKMSAPLKQPDISAKTEGNLSLNFKDALQVVYKKIREPEEYYTYRTQSLKNIQIVSVGGNGMNTSQALLPPKLYPFTEMWLTNGTPVDIKENGRINNTNLYIHGFWGWWEKIATKLPYEYYPD